MVRHRAKRVSLPLSEVLNIVNRQSGRCKYCNALLNPSNCIIEQTFSMEEVKSDPLRQVLKEWRTRTSKDNGVPAYVVLTDKSIEGIVARRPTDIVSLKDVFGIGDAKIRKYGEAIIALISENPGKSHDNEALNAICENCDGSEKIAVRIPKGQIEALREMEVPIAEVMRSGLTQMLRNPHPAFPSNMEHQQPPLEKYNVTRDIDGRLWFSFYMPEGSVSLRE